MKLVRSLLFVIVATHVASCNAPPQRNGPPPRGRGLAPSAKMDPLSGAKQGSAEEPQGSSPARARQIGAADNHSHGVERDYTRELLASVGDPARCLKARAAGSQGTAGATLQIDLEAYVVGSGSVSRSYVRSAQLDADESACVRRMLEAVHFAPPIDAPPRSVQASITLTLRAAAAPRDAHEVEPGPEPSDEAPTITTPHAEGNVEYPAPPSDENPAKEPAE